MAAQGISNRILPRLASRRNHYRNRNRNASSFSIILFITTFTTR